MTMILASPIDAFPPNDHAIGCLARMDRTNSALIATAGREQPGICATLTARVAEFPNINIVGMSTVRLGGTNGDASTFLSLMQATGDSHALTGLMDSFRKDPYLRPNGGPVVAEETGVLNILVPDRTQLLCDVTGILFKHGINIQSLRNKTYADFDYGDFDALTNIRNEGPVEINHRTTVVDGSEIVSVTRLQLEAPKNAIRAAVEEIRRAAAGGLVKWKPHRVTA